MRGYVHFDSFVLIMWGSCIPFAISATLIVSKREPDYDGGKKSPPNSRILPFVTMFYKKLIYFFIRNNFFIYFGLYYVNFKKIKKYYFNIF